MAIRRGGAAEFRKWLDEQFTITIPGWVAEQHIKLHLEIVNGWVIATPVGNPSLWKEPPEPGYVGGRARGNFQTSILVPLPGETGIIDPSGAVAQGQALAELLKIEGYAVSWTTNNVPYIVGPNSLNDGHSGQAPAQYLEQVVERVLSAVA